MSRNTWQAKGPQAPVFIAEVRVALAAAPAGLTSIDVERAGQGAREMPPLRSLAEFHSDPRYDGLFQIFNHAEMLAEKKLMMRRDLTLQRPAKVDSHPSRRAATARRRSGRR
jgi:hypothetical protein